MKATINLTISLSEVLEFLIYGGCNNFDDKKIGIFSIRGVSCIPDNLVTYPIKRGCSEFNRLGITTSKKVGCAVRRNRARRVIKESYRKLLPCMCKEGRKRLYFA
ncbi:MAG: ribonuclease P protein component [Oscillospiraceae bacterium]|nr:ribonuclease P protein component [Oscillospiraceae bacterium]